MINQKQLRADLEKLIASGVTEYRVAKDLKFHQQTITRFRDEITVPRESTLQKIRDYIDARNAES